MNPKTPPTQIEAMNGMISSPCPSAKIGEESIIDSRRRVRPDSTVVRRNGSLQRGGQTASLSPLSDSLAHELFLPTRALGKLRR